MGITPKKTRIKAEVIVEVWRKVGGEWVGATELQVINTMLVQEFGEIPSPASIARTLAENGAKIRHAEVLDFDTGWRERRLTELFAESELNFSSSIDDAIESMERIEELRKHLDLESDVAGLQRLHDFALEVKKELDQVGKARIPLDFDRQVAVEAAEWLAIWLQTPELFSDWFELRRASKGFQKLFKS